MRLVKNVKINKLVDIGKTFRVVCPNDWLLKMLNYIVKTSHHDRDRSQELSH